MASETKVDVREAHTILRELTKNSAPPNSKRVDVEKQVKIVYDQILQQDENNLDSDGLEHRAEMALNEDQVELFEKVYGWSKLENVQSTDELGVWSQSLEWLFNAAHYRGGHSVKLGTRFANSKEYFKLIEIYLLWHINNEKYVASMLKNTIILCETAPAAIGTV